PRARGRRGGERARRDRERLVRLSRARHDALRAGAAVSAPAGAPRVRRPAALAAGALVAALWFSAMFFLLLPALVLCASGAGPWPRPGRTRWVGAAILVAAHALLVAPVRAFVVEGRGTQAPIAPPGSLVTSGLFARVRNPMYSIYLAIVLGEVVLYRSAALAA